MDGGESLGASPSTPVDRYQTLWNPSEFKISQCPVGTYFDPDSGLCIAPNEPTTLCLNGYHIDEASQCCQTDLTSGRYPACPAGQAYDPLTGQCDAENIWLADGKVLHTVEFAVNVPFCDSGNNDNGNDDNDGGDDGGSACPNGKDPVCTPNGCYCPP